MTNCGSLTVSLYTGAPLPLLIPTAYERRDGDWASGGGPQASLVAVPLYVVMLRSVGADGEPDNTMYSTSHDTSTLSGIPLPTHLLVI